jgi:DNA primase
MTSTPIDDIKLRLDIVEVISGYIKLTKAGANYRAVCPFHTEKTPSFFVSPARQIWHCFGCSKGGDVFGFIKEIEGVEFGDALRILAQKAGVELKPFRPEMKEMNTQRVRLYEITELAAQFFEKQLESGVGGQEAKKYLLGRGISEESIKSWRLGYGPDTWQGLADFLVSRGYNKTEIERAGLIIKKDDGGYYDRFRGRIMFPIFDLGSQVTGFGGRVFAKKDEKEIAKYINTPATLLYDKSRTLYGLDKAKVDIRKNDSCILVEGYTDAILSHQVLVSNAVAVSGTALTPLQLKILRRYTENLLICFDMDLAGDTATKRGIDLALSQGFNIKVITLPEGKDPADLVVKSPEAWLEAVKNAKSILEFYFETTLTKFDKNKIEGKKEISKILLAVIKKIPNRIEQTFWLQRLSQEISAKEEDLALEMSKIKTEEDALGLDPEEIINLPQKSRAELLEERLLVLVLKNRQNLEQLTETDFSLFTTEACQIITAFKKEADTAVALKCLEGLALEKANYLLLKSEALEEISAKDEALDFKDCLREIKNMGLKKQLGTLSQEIRKAETGKDKEKTASLADKFHQLVKKLSEL